MYAISYNTCLSTSALVCDLTLAKDLVLPAEATPEEVEEVSPPEMIDFC